MVFQEVVPLYAGEHSLPLRGTSRAPSPTDVKVFAKEAPSGRELSAEQTEGVTRKQKFYQRKELT